MNPSDIDLGPSTKAERRAVGMAANAAFLKMCEYDPTWLADNMRATGLSKSRLMEDWRHRQVKHITKGRAARVSDLTQRDAGLALATFAGMAGQDVRAFQLHLRTGPATGKAGSDGDDQNAIRQWRHKIATEGPGYGFNEGWQRGYVRNVFGKEGVRSLDDCNARQLRALYLTMRSRYLKNKAASK